MRRLCVTGGCGLLGSKILEAAADDYILLSIDISCPCEPIRGRYEHVVCDVSNGTALTRELERFRPDVIIHTAALTDVDGCESRRDDAYRINVEGTGNVVDVCRRCGIKLIHISTDYVFDGKAGPYSETDAPHPINVYGRTKLESEELVTRALDRYVIARSMVLYGYYRAGRLNYVTWLVDALRRKEPVRIVDDQVGTPTLADDLAQALILIDKRDVRGLFHTAGNDCLTRYEFALQVADIFDLDGRCISRIQSETLKQPARRPLRSGLLNGKVTQVIGPVFSGVPEGLRVLKSQMASDGYGQTSSP